MFATEVQAHLWLKKLWERLMDALQQFPLFLEANTAPRRAKAVLQSLASPSNGSPHSKGFRGCTKTGPTSEDICPLGSSPQSEGSRTPPPPGLIGAHKKMDPETNVAG